MSTSLLNIDEEIDFYSLNLDVQFIIVRFLGPNDLVNALLAGLFAAFREKKDYYPKNTMLFNMIESSFVSEVGDNIDMDSYKCWYNRVLPFSLSPSVKSIEYFRMVKRIKGEIKKELELVKPGLVNDIIQNRGIVAGGFVLKYVLEILHNDTSYKYGDVDVFVPSVSFEKLIHKKHNKISCGPNYERLGFRVAKYSDNVQFITYCNRSIKEISYSFVGNILCRFDMSHVRVAYDPYSNEIYITPLAYYSIMNKVILPCRKVLLSRIHKYEKRGFTYVGSMDKTQVNNDVSSNGEIIDPEIIALFESTFI
jgi:hypothetical protein